MFKVYLIFTLYLVCVSIPPSTSRDIAAVHMAEEIGKGVGKLAHYLNSLISGCDPLNLDEWLKFMETFLQCKEDATREKTYEELINPDPTKHIEEKCEEWPKLHKCYVSLAGVLDSCYERQDGHKMKGTDALKFSDVYSRFICHHKHQYLANVESNTGTYIPADRKPLKCYIARKEGIERCASKKFRAQPSPSLCWNFEIIQECFDMNYKDCEKQDTKDLVSTMLKQISMDLKCTHHTI